MLTKNHYASNIPDVTLAAEDNQQLKRHRVVLSLEKKYGHIFTFHKFWFCKLKENFYERIYIKSSL